MESITKAVQNKYIYLRPKIKDRFQENKHKIGTQPLRDQRRTCHLAGTSPFCLGKVKVAK